MNLGKTVRLLPFGGGEPETAQAVDIDGEFGLVVRGADAPHFCPMKVAVLTAMMPGVHWPMA